MIGLMKRLSPALTHAIAAGVGGVLVLLVPQGTISSLRPVRITTTAITPDGAVSSVSYNPVAILLLFALLGAVLAIAAVLIARFIPSLARMAAIRVLPREVSAQAGLFLEEEIARVLSHVRTYGDANDRYLKSLLNSRASLGALPTPDQLRVAMTLLIDENERMRKTSSDLKMQLFDTGHRLKELKRDQTRVEELARAEPIPGIGPRRAFDEALKKAVASAEADSRPLSLVICDISQFKALNEKFGPTIADEFLHLLAGFITPNLGSGDVAARYSRERIAILLPNMTLSDANRFVDRIKKKLEGQVITIRATQQKIENMTASFGVAEWKKGELGEVFAMRASALV